MSSQHLRWTGEGFTFTGTDSSGAEVAFDGDGGGVAAKPADLLPLSLAACTAHDVVNILRKQRQDLLALEARIDSEQDDQPPWRFRRISVSFVARGAVDEMKARKALALAEEKYCSVSATLRDTVALTFSIEVQR